MNSKEAEPRCRNCRHYTPRSAEFMGNKFDGSCKRVPVVESGECTTPRDGVLPWDHEGYRAGLSVGPDFGCVHFKLRARRSAAP